MKKLLTILILLIFLANAVSAYTFLNLYVEDNGVVTFLGETNENLSLPQGVNVQDGKIVGSTSLLTSKSGEAWSLAYSLQGAEINLVLPKGAVIKQVSNGEISTQNDQISIYFQNSTNILYTIENVSQSNIISAGALSLIVLSVLVIIALIYFIRHKRKQGSKKNSKHKKQNSKKNKQNIIQQLLNEREKTILSKLKETGKIKQSHLRRLVQIPKASFSRHLQELEKKNLIKRSGDGKNKFVELS